MHSYLMCLFFRLIQNKISDDAASDFADAFRSNSALTHLMYDRLYLIISVMHSNNCFTYLPSAACKWCMLILVSDLKVYNIHK